MTLPSAETVSAPPGRVPRFSVGERVLHWLNAGLFGVLLATAAVLYVPSLAATVGRRASVRAVHVWSGLLLPVPLLASLVLSEAFRLDVRRLARWSSSDVRWLRSFGGDPLTRHGKFHPGQKLNAAFVLGAIGVMLGSGSILHWFDPFPVAIRRGATFVHDWTALAVAVVVVGHVAKALTQPEAVRGMIVGDVDAAWARRHHPAWPVEAALPVEAGGVDADGER